jgi:hypothetical protein
MAPSDFSEASGGAAQAEKASSNVRRTADVMTHDDIPHDRARRDFQRRGWRPLNFRVRARLRLVAMEFQ